MMDWVCIRLSSLFLSVCQNTCVILCSRLHQSRHTLRPGGPDFPRLYRSVQCCLLLIQKHRPVPTFNYFTAQSLHSRYGSADPCPTLRTHVTTLFTRTRYGRLAIPYPTGFSCCVSPAYKDFSGKTACAVFSVRTLKNVLCVTVKRYTRSVKPLFTVILKGNW